MAHLFLVNYGRILHEEQLCRTFPVDFVCSNGFPEPSDVLPGYCSLISPVDRHDMNDFGDFLAQVACPFHVLIIDTRVHGTRKLEDKSDFMTIIAPVLPLLQTIPPNLLTFEFLGQNKFIGDNLIRENCICFKEFGFSGAPLWLEQHRFAHPLSRPPSPRPPRMEVD